MTEHTIDTVDVLSLAKILGLIGLLWGLVIAASWILIGGPLGGRPGLPELLLAIVGGALYGLVGGAITAIVYNLAATMVGGIKIELS